MNAVGIKIGGKVGRNIASGISQNAGPIYISCLLNKTKFPIPAAGYSVVSGADRNWHMFHVPEMRQYLAKSFGKPDASATNSRPQDFAGKEGILVVKGYGWSNAVGYVTLWNGQTCSDSCHFSFDPDNGPFELDTASLWSLT